MEGVSADADGYDAVAMLYRAGVLTGSAGGRFEPERTITRAEVAAIATRMVDSALRVR